MKVHAARRRRPIASGRPSCDDRGSIVIVGAILLMASLLIPLVVGVSLSQLTLAHTTTDSTDALTAAEAGIDAAVGDIRAAGSNGVGSLSSLPCTSPHSTPAGAGFSLTGPANTAAAGTTYTTTVWYLSANPAGNLSSIASQNTSGVTWQSWVSSNEITCSSGSPGSQPSYALLLSTGKDPASSVGFAPTRTLTATYDFLINQSGVPGGPIYDNQYQYCITDTNTTPTAGDALNMQPCVLGSAQDSWAYNANYQLVLASTISSANPLCIAWNSTTVLASLQLCSSSSYAEWGSDGDRHLLATTSPSYNTTGNCLAMDALPYNNVGITNNTNTAPGNLDGNGYSFSAQALSSAGVNPGGTVTAGGFSFTWPNVPAGQPDDMTLSGQVVNVLPQSASTLAFLGASTYAGASGYVQGTVSVTYTDGTTSSGTITLSDWYVNLAYSGDSVAFNTSAWNTPSGAGSHEVSVYLTTIPLSSGKKVASITFPSNSKMHIFAMNLTPATLTNQPCEPGYTEDQSWYESPEVGPGAAGASKNQWVNFEEFGRCLDVTDDDYVDGYARGAGPGTYSGSYPSGTNYPSQTSSAGGATGPGGFLIDYPCKQNPNGSAVENNQQFSEVPVSYNGTSYDELQTTSPNNSTYCLWSPLTSVNLTPGAANETHSWAETQPCPTSPITSLTKNFLWTVYGDTGQLQNSYTVQDVNNNCLEANTGDPQKPAGNTDYFTTIAVGACDSSYEQKWNASGLLGGAGVSNIFESG